ncbi:MAG: DMT family transporter [Akkermansiaceae bacterium]
MKPISETKGTILMLLSIVCFTANTLVVRALSIHYPGCDGWQVTLFRGVAGMLVVVSLYSGSRGLRLKSLIDRPKIVVRGILGAGGVVIYYLTIIELGAARAVVINLTYPIFAALLAAIVLKESLGLSRLTWIITGFIGLMIFMGPEALDRGLSGYDLLAVGGALLAASVVVLIRTLHQSEHGSTIFASQAAFCILVAAPSSLGESPDLPTPVIIGLSLAGLIVAAGQLTMTFAYRHLAVSKGSSMQMLLPVFTAAGAWLFFEEVLNAIELSGAALTLVATAMVNRGTSKSPLKMPSNPTPIHDNT